ncbi:MAG: hypothetical protein M1151_01925 [Candidatus Thermoplasmatota archaeon]|nr:hypothetical protein [Candidatus Thermoplasmatota archaeon]MCL5785412.1 hypothetical protein [Candidatus Thermoplasmatota archaeon]
MNPDLPSIEEGKLYSYVNSNRSYTLRKDGENIELRFVPSFPEAQSHLPNGEEVEHVMTGFLSGGMIYFTHFITRSSFGETVTDLKGKDDPVMLWLQYI